MVSPIASVSGINYVAPTFSPSARAVNQEQSINTVNNLERSPERDCFVSSQKPVQTDKEVSFGGRVNMEKIAEGLKGLTRIDAVDLIKALKEGKKAESLTDVEIFNIWIHRFYEKLKDAPEAMKVYMARINDTCKNSLIKIKEGDTFLTRTISVHSPSKKGDVLQISNPNIENMPAAAARGGINEMLKIEEGFLSRVHSDKAAQIEAPSFSGSIQDSTLFAIKTTKDMELVGFDYRELGKVEFGSSVFKRHVDKNDCSTEVLFPHEAKFQLIEDLIPDTLLDIVDTKGNPFQFRLITKQVTPVSR